MDIISAGIPPEQSTRLTDPLASLAHEQAAEALPVAETEDVTPHTVARTKRHVRRRSLACLGLEIVPRVYCGM
jgi:hypothetical protein